MQKRFKAPKLSNQNNGEYLDQERSMTAEFRGIAALRSRVCTQSIVGVQKKGCVAVDKTHPLGKERTQDGQQQDTRMQTRKGELP